MPFNLLKLSEDNGIQIEVYDFKSPIEALYKAIPGYPPVIGLSKTLLKSTSHLRSVWAHELGHHFTSGKSTIRKTFLHYRDRLECNRDEHRAWRWAANYLVPEDTLLRAIGNGIIEMWRLAEFFEVDINLISIRLKLLGLRGNFNAKCINRS